MAPSERQTGTVTFLFTDIEGSTWLLKQLRERYASVLADHRRLLRSAFIEHGGEEVDTQGDSFFFVFRRAQAAAIAAAGAQRALSAHDWPDGLDVRVRMGMHTGEALLSGESYAGLGIHRAARIMAAAHGGQVLLSQATCSVLEDDDLPGIRLRDLGEYPLKGLDRPERIHQLVIHGLASDFPPLTGHRADVPFGGRDAELAEGANAAIRGPFHRRRIALGVSLGVAAMAVASLVFLLGRSGVDSQRVSRVSGSSVGVIDSRTGKIVGDVPGLPGISDLAAGAGAIWAADGQGQTVSRIDPASRTVRQTIPVGNGPSGMVVGAGAVWVVNSLDGNVTRIDPKTNGVVDTVRVGNRPTAIASVGHRVYVTNSADQTLSQIDAAKDRVTTIGTRVPAAGIAIEHGSAWLSDSSGGAVSRLDLRSGQVIDTVNVGSGPTAIAYGGGSVWVANSLDGTVSRIDPRRGIVTAVVPTGVAPNGLAVSHGAVWVSDEVKGNVVRIDSRTGQVTLTRHVGGRPEGVAIQAGSVWLAVQAVSRAHRGGTLRVASSSPFDSIDPAVAYTQVTGWMLSVVGDGLTGYKRVGGREGNSIVPDLAVSLPKPTNGGRTYTFQLRPNIRFSTGVRVKPADVRWTFERLFKLRSDGAPFYIKIAGAADCARSPKTCDLTRGISADAAGHVTFHLTAPDNEFLFKLALPFATLVPTGARAGTASRPIPGTGPYRIAFYAPARKLVLTRNPWFHEWSRVAQPFGYPDRIIWQLGPVGLPALEQQVTAVEQGRLDWVTDFPQNRLREVRTHYASQVHITPTAETDFMLLNNRLPPFDHLAARRAVNYAVDRARLAGGTSTPTCQILPPNFPAYEAYCPYTLRPHARSWTAPDWHTARRLVARSGTAGMRVQVVDGFKKEGEYFTSLLNQLGYRATFRYIPFPQFFTVFSASANTIQAAGSQWIADYPAASNFITPFRCGGGNLFCDPAVDRAVARASARTDVQGSANKLWSRLDRHLVDQAAAVPLENFSGIDFVSRRVGNYQHHPVFGILLDQLWVH